MRLTVCLVFLLTLFGLNAAEQKILEVKTVGLGKNKELKSSLHVKASSRTAKALALILETEEKPTERYAVSQLKKGVVLKQEKGLNIITISSRDFEPDRGGHFQLTYLKNGLKKTYAKQELEVELSQDRWKVFHRGEEVEKLDFKVKKLFGKPIGIDKIVVKTVD